VAKACTGPPWQECVKLFNEDLQVWFHSMPFGRHFVIMIMLEGGVEAGLNVTAVRPRCSLSCPTHFCLCRLCRIIIIVRHVGHHPHALQDVAG
jgi:hypothetical protein